MLISLGCDPAFISDFLGDLREEFAERSARDGRLGARAWQAREIVRSAPHIVWSAIRDGNAASRARLGALSLGAVLTFALATIGWVMHKGPPAHIVADAAYSDGIVINSIRPVRLSMQVVDAAGHRLDRSDVRYRLASGSGVNVSADGLVTCARRADAVLRASIDRLSKDFVVHCQPIKEVRYAGWGNFIAGDRARALSVDAIGLDGYPVTQIAARLRVEDSTVATLDASELRPLRPGSTPVDIEIGDESRGGMVTVFERVATFEGLRADQRWVVAPIHLTRGESLRWTLPVGDFFLAFSSDSTDLPPPRGFGSIILTPSSVDMSVAGPIMCMPDLGRGLSNTHCLARGRGATLTIAHPGRGAPDDIVGLIALERMQQR